MSVKLMSAIFETEMRDLPYTKDGEERNAKASTAKLVLLALADHANDYGESTYPGYDRLEIKTALSRQGLADTFQALQQNGIITVDVKGSRLGTNNYTINIKSFPPMYKEAESIPELVKPLDSQKSSHLTQPSQATRLESSVNPKKKPSVKAEKTPKEPTPPEVLVYREVTRLYPPKVNWGDVVKIVQSVSKRIGRDATAADLLPFFSAWTFRGNKPTNINWTSWAVSGVIPQQYTQKQQPENKGINAVMQWQSMKGVSNGD